METDVQASRKAFRRLVYLYEPPDSAAKQNSASK